LDSRVREAPASRSGCSCRDRGCNAAGPSPVKPEQKKLSSLARPGAASMAAYFHRALILQGPAASRPTHMFAHSPPAKIGAIAQLERERAAAHLFRARGRHSGVARIGGRGEPCGAILLTPELPLGQLCTPCRVVANTRPGFSLPPRCRLNSGAPPGVGHHARGARYSVCRVREGPTGGRFNLRPNVGCYLRTRIASCVPDTRLSGATF
jgi:hypothetical protein